MKKNSKPATESKKGDMVWSDSPEAGYLQRSTYLSWPRITIVTPSFNQGQFLEETITSVLSQNYPNLEYIIIDGGSTDNSVEIIKKYESQLAYWVSEPDRGQAHAINKGFERCTGDLVGWINSDDMLLPGSLEKLACSYSENPGRIILGDGIEISEESKSELFIYQNDVKLENMIIAPLSNMIWFQPGTFVPNSLLQKGFLLDESLRYTFDQDWMCRLLTEAEVFYLHELLAVFRLHPQSKTVREEFFWMPEHYVVLKRYLKYLQVQKQSRLLADFELRWPSISLKPEYLNLRYGYPHLWKSLVLRPSIIGHLQFWITLIKGLFPKFMAVKLRSFLHKSKTIALRLEK